MTPELRTITDVIRPLSECTGDVVVRPFGPDRQPLADPFSIFENPELARDNCLGLDDHHIVLGDNLVVNGGRQTVVNLLGGRDWDPGVPNDNWIVKYVRFGSYDQAPRFTDITLSPQPSVSPPFVGGENTIEINNSGDIFKLITAVDWPQPFIARFEIELNLDEANGFLVREMGLFTGNHTMVARKAFVGIAKTSQFGLSFLWRLRA